MYTHNLSRKDDFKETNVNFSYSSLKNFKHKLVLFEINSTLLNKVHNYTKNTKDTIT